MQLTIIPPPIQSSYSDEGLFTSAHRQNLALERSEYSKWYCIKEILYEQYLWDMRCWQKPKSEYTNAEVMEQIKKWILEHQAGNWSSNCGHCLYCMRKLLATRQCTLAEIADYCLRNNFIKYPNQINTWSKQTGDLNSPEKGEQLYV